MVFRFDNRVAIITGAGQGLGKAYAKYFGRHGARIVVNDCDAHAAQQVVQEIGPDRAVASHDSVEHGERIVELAMQKCIIRDSSFAKMTAAEWDAVYQVHLKGTMSVMKAAWQVMRDQQYGRIVNISSASGLYGNFGQANYAAAKLGIAGLSLTLAQEGAKHNIHVNVVAPLAASQMTQSILDEEFLQKIQPEQVAPFVGYLCHEACTRNGKIYEVGAGWVSQVRWQRSNGVVFDAATMTMDSIATRIDEIEDFDSQPCEYPRSLQDTVAKLRSLQSRLKAKLRARQAKL